RHRSMIRSADIIIMKFGARWRHCRSRNHCDHEIYNLEPASGVDDDRGGKPAPNRNLDSSDKYDWTTNYHDEKTRSVVRRGVGGLSRKEAQRPHRPNKTE